MSLLTRHSGAPFVDGEVLDAGTPGAELGLEFDLKAWYLKFNGDLDNDQFADDADLQGSKLLVTSLDTAKLASNAVTAAKILAESVPNAAIAALAVTIGKVEIGAISTSAEAVADASGSQPPTVPPAQYVLGTEVSILTGELPTAVLVVYQAIVSTDTANAGVADATIDMRLRRTSPVAAVLFETGPFQPRGDRNAGELGDAGSDVNRVAMQLMFMDEDAPANSLVKYRVDWVTAGPITPTNPRASTNDELLYLLNVRR